MPLPALLTLLFQVAIIAIATIIIVRDGLRQAKIMCPEDRKLIRARSLQSRIKWVCLGSMGVIIALFISNIVTLTRTGVYLFDGTVSAWLSTLIMVPVVMQVRNTLRITETVRIEVEKALQ